MWFGSYLYWEVNTSNNVSDSISDLLPSKDVELNEVELELDSTATCGDMNYSETKKEFQLISSNNINSSEIIMQINNDVYPVDTDCNSTELISQMDDNLEANVIHTNIPIISNSFTINIPPCKIYVSHLKGRTYDSNQINKKLYEIQLVHPNVMK